MSGIIQLLPDSIANQIAAGEVIQRPASAIKELMENAIDAGATQIKVIIKDAGKSLIQVIDNGCGMNETDARLCWERHATSKLKKVDDLFAIRTFGFRGEALASIAAVAQVEMKTKLHNDETGTYIEIEDSHVVKQQSCVTAAGTVISIKNLFYNVPARRNFLKSNPVETRHIIEEFQRVAIPNFQISFTLHHNGIEIFNLPSGNLRQRICGIFGANYNERLVPVEEETTITNIKGFVIKPEFAKKVRGEQYFFINNRYIKEPYLHHAVANAFEELLPKGSYPSYFLMFTIDPSKVDINIHPSKTEIKFEDERSVYAILRAAVKRSLGKFSVAPSLDFERETSFDVPVADKNKIPKQPQIRVDAGYNPFEKENLTSATSSKAFKPFVTDWQKLYDLKTKTEVSLPDAENETAHKPELDLHHETHTETFFAQLNNRYIVTTLENELVVIDQQAAHERILFEKNMELIEQQTQTGQQELFPLMLEFTPAEFETLSAIMEEVKKLGFDLRLFGKNTFILHSCPAFVKKGHEKKLLENVIEQYARNYDTSFTMHKRVAAALARSASVKQGQELKHAEMKNLVSDLLKCKKPFAGINGRPSVIKISLDDIGRKFLK